jgi:outer membrane protein OmpA-like peptidoglycan-associated protein
MKNPIIWLLLGLAGWLGFSRYLQMRSCGCGSLATATITGASAVLSAPVVAASSILIADGSKLNVGFNENLTFSTNGYEYKKSLSAKLNAVFKQTADYLKTNPTRGLKITGIYAASEKNTSVYDNLGLGRANHVKTIFTALGVPATQIMTDSDLQSDLSMTNNQVIGGATYSFSTLEAKKPEADTRLMEIEKRIKVAPMILYFETGKEALQITNQQRKDFADMQYYAERKPDTKLMVAGHTDNRGAAEKNKMLSKGRADFVQKQLGTSGFDLKQILTTGFGQEKPIAPNEDDAGRAKNRRVEISIQ